VWKRIQLDSFLQWGWCLIDWDAITPAQGWGARWRVSLVMFPSTLWSSAFGKCTWLGPGSAARCIATEVAPTLAQEKISRFYFPYKN